MLGLDYDSSSEDEQQQQQQQQRAATTVRLPNAAALLAGGAPGPSGLSSLPPPDFGSGAKRDHPDTRGPRSTPYDRKVPRR